MQFILWPIGVCSEGRLEHLVETSVEVVSLKLVFREPYTSIKVKVA